LESKATRLNQSLSDAVKLIDEIGKQIMVRQQLATKLQSDIQNMDQIASMKKPEVEAVRKLFRDEFESELKRQRRYSFRDTFLISFISNIILCLRASSHAQTSDKYYGPYLSTTDSLSLREVMR